MTTSSVSLCYAETVHGLRILRRCLEGGPKVQCERWVAAQVLRGGERGRVSGLHVGWSARSRARRNETRHLRHYTCRTPMMKPQTTRSCRGVTRWAAPSKGAGIICISILLACGSENGSDSSPSSNGAGTPGVAPPPATGAANATSGSAAPGGSVPATSDGETSPANPAANDDMNDTPTEPAGEVTPTVDEITGVDPLTLPDGVPFTTQLGRLTYSEYDRALSDLLFLDVAPSSLFPSEQATLHGYFDRAALRVTERLHDELVRVAEDLAAQLVATPAAYEQVVGCSPDEAGCRDSFLNDFGLRSFRRPLTGAELERYQNLFDSAGALIQSGDDFADGVQLSVEAMLQSPHFLYRVERGEAVADEYGTPLTDYEIATRLSFTLLGSTPDAELLSRASAGGLSTPEEIVVQAERLVALPEVRDRVVDFHDRWLELGALVGVSKDAGLYPAFTPELTTAMRAETLRFVEDTTLTEGGAISHLLSANHTFVDAQLAELYGVPGSFGSELERVELTDGVRGGLLTQGSFLSGHTSSSTITSPILRGIFVLRRVLCQDVPEPPPNATQQEPPPSETPILTTREFFAWKTSMVACVGCHSIINPVGFAFEGFDAIGVARTTEDGAPIDTTGVALLSGQQIPFADARDLSTRIAALPEAHGCYAKNWLQYAYGRRDTTQDLRTMGVIARNLATDTYGVRQLLVDLTRGAAFSHLAVSE